MTQPIPPRFTVNTPPEAEVGVFANFASIWADDAMIILDFIVTSNQPQLGSAEDGTPVADVPCRTVSRVRITPAQALELVRGLTNAVDAWELGHGPINRAPDSPEGL